MKPSTSYSSTVGGVLIAQPQPLSMIPAFGDLFVVEERCPWTLAYGNGWNTRCRSPLLHARMHGGLGQANWPYEFVQWLSGDPRAYESARTDLYAWYDAGAALRAHIDAHTHEPVVTPPAYSPTPHLAGASI